MSKHRSIEARRSLVEGFGGSGLSVEAYCARESIKVSSFRRWRRQLMDAPDVARMGPRGKIPARSVIALLRPQIAASRQAFRC